MPEITFFAETNHRNQQVKFGIKNTDRRRHMYVIGKTGTGKTTLLDNMTIQDIRRGNGVAVLDPHGEYAERMLNFVPKERINDVVYFNPADLDHPFGFNLIENPDPKMRHFVASGLMGVFKKLWPDVWSARMEYFLSNSILAHLEMEDATLLGVNRIFGDSAYRKAIVSHIQDPVVRGFWENEFAKLPEQFMREAVAAIQNKVGQFIANPLIRNVIGQPRSTFDLRDIMDNRKIFIANLAKGRIGEENSALFGAMLVTRIYLAAMSRVDMPEEAREDFYVYVDEFQNFATESFANILSEARKYHLCLTLANQYMAQLVDDKTKSAVLRDAIIGNVGTMISFRIGAEDAETLEKEFLPEFAIQDFVNLGFANIYLKLMIDNVASRPFSAVTLPPLPPPPANCAREIIEASQKKYGTAVGEIDALIREWGGFAPLKISADLPRAGAAVTEPTKVSPPPDAGAVSSQKSAEEDAGFQSRPFSAFEVARELNRERERQMTEKKAAKKKSQKMYPAVCAIDGQPIEVPFQPDGRRPVYCEDHLAQIQRGSQPLRQAGAAPPPAAKPSDLNSSSRNFRASGRQSDRRIPPSVPRAVENSKPISLAELLPPRSGENFENNRERPKNAPEKKNPDLAELRKMLSGILIENASEKKATTPQAAEVYARASDSSPRPPPAVPAAQPSPSGQAGVIQPGGTVKFE